MKKVISLVLALLIVFSLVSINTNKTASDEPTRVYDHSALSTTFNDIAQKQNYPYSELRNLFNSLDSDNRLTNITNELSGKKIAIETASDLYQWSQDLSYSNNQLSLAMKNALASQSYVLTSDIDYSIMRSSRFMPIGFHVNNDVLEFTGTFDGQGFEIYELYFESYSNYNFEVSEIVYLHSFYFSMFNRNNGGTIKNFGLLNPIIDLENEHANLANFAYIVGSNNGLVENVYVEDNRLIGEAGIRAVATKTQNPKRAAAIVNTNEAAGVLRNAYYAGSSVINADYVNAILEKPIYYQNNGTVSNISNIGYDQTIYGTNVLGFTGNGSGQNGLTTTALKNGSTSIGNSWYAYPTDGYPKLFGLETKNDKYQINNAIEFLYFTKMINLNSTGFNGLTYAELDYVINNDLNMEDISPNAIKTVEKEFSGVLEGLNQNIQINNLVFNEGIIIGNNYYLGLFSILTGTVRNLKFNNYSIYPNFVENLSSQTFKVGIVAGELSTGGHIEDISLRGDIDFSNANFKLGSFIVGSLVGEASGFISKVYVASTSDINIGSQSYLETDYLNNNFYVGGIIGKTGNNRLLLYNVLSYANISNMATTNIYINNSNSINTYTGGIIGYVENFASEKNQFGLLTNRGSITNNSINSTNTINQYLGGVIGYSTGSMYEFNSLYGLFRNEGSIINSSTHNHITYLAGILNSAHSEAVEFTQINNTASLSITQTNTYASLLVNQITNQKLTVSQAETTGSLTVTNVIRSLAAAINTNFENSELDLRYVVVDSDFTITHTSNTINSELNYAGVTLNQNANYLNVSYGGELTFNNNSANTATAFIWISGITKVLSSGKVMKNVLNEGSMTINAKSSANLLIAGLVNRNLSGDLHLQDNSNRPRATIGVINSINQADIWVDKSGTGNTIVGGLVTINGSATVGASVQDATNMGDVNVYNATNGSASFSSSANTGGIVESYSSGVIVGGVTAVVAHGESRIYDTSNSGDVIGIASHFVRAAGVLAMAFRHELDKAGLEGYFNNSNIEINSSAIRMSVLSNGINYGDIQAVTQNIILYDTNNATGTNPGSGIGGGEIPRATRVGTNERLGIHASAGGVIGYGLSTMNRMLNHGNISSTDVAGGIVGATMAYNESSANNTNRAYIVVNINTAINYGEIKAIRTANYSGVVANRKALEAHHYTEIGNDKFIMPATQRTADLRIHPESRRGFGGIFGRLQRALSQVMTSRTKIINNTTVVGSFDFVVNMDPNSNLIGRLDQVYDYTSSMRYFHFGNAKYYSANPNDMTQAVFTGTYNTRNTILNHEVDVLLNATMNVQVTHTYTRTGSGTTWNPYLYHKTSTINFSGTTVNFYYNYTVRIGDPSTATNFSPANHNINDSYRILDKVESSFSTSLPGGVSNSTTPIDGVTFTNNNPQYRYEYPDPETVQLSYSVAASPSKSTNWYQGVRNVPYITEVDNGDPNAYVYHPDFEMRQDSTTLTNGEPITSYIYYASNNLLAEQFEDTRPNGMYVLSTTAGSTFGSVLPRNINVNAFRRLETNISNNINYDNPSDSQLLTDEPRHNQFLNDFKNELYQTTLNDKSALLKDDQLVTAKDNGTNKLELFYQNASFTGNNITFNIDNSMIGSNRSVTLEMLEAQLPENALIARKYLGEDDPDYNSIDEFQAALEAFRLANPSKKVATGNLAPTLENTLTGGAATTAIGTFVSYSEAAVMNPGFTSSSDYYTEYTVSIETRNTSGANPALNGVGQDGGTISTNLDNRTINETINLRFIDSGSKLDYGYTIDNYLELYYFDGTNEHLVEREYYQILSQPFSNTNRQFFTDIIFSEQLRNGTYRLKYKFWNSQSLQTLNINYQRTRNQTIIEMLTNSGTFYDGNTANIAFGDLSIPTGNLVVGNGYTVSYDSEIPIYLDRNVYHIPFLNRFVTSDTFFDITAINITSETINNYRTYTLTFSIVGGGEVIKTIREDYLVPRYFKNGVNIPATIINVRENEITTTASREVELTTFSLEYNMLASALNINNFRVYVDGVRITKDGMVEGDPNATTITNGAPLGSIKYNLTNRLNIVVDKNVLPRTNDYEIEIFYVRDNIEIPAGFINLEKLEGTSAYLNNIKFSEFVSGIEYPDIFVTNANGDEILVWNPATSSYEPKYKANVYFRGIDYSSADVAGEKYFRIDGEVAGTPLNSYVPTNIINYLPIGAGISVKKPDINGNMVWSEIVTTANTPEEIQAALATDFTVYVGDDELYYVDYRIIPEKDLSPLNTSNAVYYSMSVTDITYSFLAVFNIYYRDSSSVIPIYESELFDDVLVHLSVNNYRVSENGTEIVADTPLELGYFPTFDQVIVTRSRLNMFYHINDETVLSYIYGLGNNFSGFYHFQMDIPKGYKYTIYLNNYDDEDVLPLMATNIENLAGFYYYINESPRTRTRYFDIVIEIDPLASDENWGLTDYNNTWD